VRSPGTFGELNLPSRRRRRQPLAPPRHLHSRLAEILLVGRRRAAAPVSGIPFTSERQRPGAGRRRRRPRSSSVRWRIYAGDEVMPGTPCRLTRTDRACRRRTVRPTWAELAAAGRSSTRSRQAAWSSRSAGRGRGVGIPWLAIRRTAALPRFAAASRRCSAAPHREPVAGLQGRAASCYTARSAGPVRRFVCLR
jgi:hypothetical protein